MDDFILARIVHVIAITLWIGGVAFVTLVVMPMLMADEAPDARLARFQQIERGFAWQARIWVALAGASGLWMVWRADMWSRFADLHFWWMHAMVAVWAVFAAMLFIIEPLHLHRHLAQSTAPASDFARMVIMHKILLAVSMVAILGAVGGSHGFF